MSRVQKFPSNSESACPPFAPGKRKAKSTQSELVADTGSITSQPSSKKPKTTTRRRAQIVTTSSTAEFPPQNRAMISNDRFNIRVHNFQGTESSQTSDPASTSKGKGCVPFWMKHKEADYAKLLWPTETDYVDSPLTSLSGLSPKGAQHSWFKTESKTFNTSSQRWPSYTCSIVDSTVCDGTSASSKPTPKKKKEDDNEEQKGETLQRKIRLFPTAAQTTRLKRWMEASRWSYNQAVFAINQRNMANQKRKTQDKKVRRQWSAISLRNVVARTRKHLRLFEDVPVHIMSYAVTDAVTALKSNIAKWKKNPKHHFELHYKRTNDPQTAITIEKTAAKILDSALMFYPWYMEKLPIRCSKIPPLIPRGKPQCDNRLSLDAQGHFYFHITIQQTPSEVQTSSIPRQSVVALDPGVRKFLTAYSPDGWIAHLGTKHDTGRLAFLKRRVQTLVARTKALPKKQRQKKYRMKKAAQRARDRIKHLVLDMHCKISNYLVKSFSVIVLPDFRSQQMSKKKAPNGKKRTIGRGTVKLMQTLSHYSFRTRLLQKAARTPECKVLICGEQYTTKTCGLCGKINPKVGSSERFRCTCGASLDRDVNAARNILLRNLHSVEAA